MTPRYTFMVSCCSCYPNRWDCACVGMLECPQKRLRLNSGEAQFIWLDGLIRISLIDLSALCRSFPDSTLSAAVRDFGNIADQKLTLSNHVNNVCRTYCYHLCPIRSVRRSLTTSRRLLLHWSTLSYPTKSILEMLSVLIWVPLLPCPFIVLLFFSYPVRTLCFCSPYWRQAGIRSNMHSWYIAPLSIRRRI